MIYLDNAATTCIKPYSVINAVKNELLYSANPGRSSHKLSIKSFNNIYKARELLCELFKVNKPENFVLTPNATYALNYAIKGILKSYDHVIITSMEHNSVIRPVYNIPNISVTVVIGDKYGYINPENIKNNIKSNTALIIINHSSNVNGIVQNIKEISKIAKLNNIPILIDASQSAGILDINAINYDMIAFPGHKSLYGPQGTGGLYINSNINLNTIIEGGTGNNSKSKNNPLELPERLESGTLNTPGFCGLSEGIKFVLKETTNGIKEYEHSLLQLLINKIKNLNGITLYSPDDINLISNSVSFNINNLDSTLVADIFDKEYNICVRPGYHCAYPAHENLGSEKSGSVRISVSYFNTKSEIDKLIDAIYYITKNVSTI